MNDRSHTLTTLIEHVSASDKPVSVGWDDVQQWQEGVLADFVTLGLLVKGVQSRSLTCTGCEQQCFMPVDQTEDGQRAFIVCDDPIKQEQMGIIKVPLVRLQQWRASAKQFAEVIVDLLRFKSRLEYQKPSASYKLGMLKGEGGRRWVSLVTQPLAIQINNHVAPLNEILYFSEAVLEVDKPRIDELLNLSPESSSKAYTPDVSKQEARKLATLAMYQDWRDAYLALKVQHPGKPDTWYSMKIAKLQIAQGRDPDTIRKNMKK